MEGSEIILALLGSLGTLATAYAVIQEARIRNYKELLAVKGSRCDALEQEAKEYVAILLTLGAQDGMSMDQAKAMASKVLRGQRGYG